MTDTIQYTFVGATLLSINMIIGGGVYAGPQVLTMSIGTIGFIGWLIAAVLIFPTVWGISKASAIFPGECGFYSYCESGLNSNFGFIAQWMYLLGYTMGTATAMTVLVSESLATEFGFMYALEYPLLINAIVLFICTSISLASDPTTKCIQEIGTMIKLSPLFLAILLALFRFDQPLVSSSFEASDLKQAVPLVIFSYLGFESSCVYTALIEGGGKAVSKIIKAGFFATVVLYFIFHYSALKIMGVAGISTSGAISFPGAAGIESEFEACLMAFVSVAVLLSFLNSLFGVTLGNVKTAMLLFPIKRSKIVITHGIFTWLFLYFVKDLQVIFGFTVLGVGTAYVLTVLAVLRKCLNEKKWFYFYCSILSLMSCFLLFYCCWLILPGTLNENAVKLSPILFFSIAGFLGFKFNFY